MKKIKVIQIGIGHAHATGILDDMLNQPDIFDVMGLALPDDEKEKYIYKFEKYKNLRIMSVDEALNRKDIDAVTVEVYETNLTKYALMAIEHGFDVHMDKPGGINVNSFKKLTQTAKEKNKILHLGYMYRYNTEIQSLFEKADNGELGEIYSVETQMSGYNDADMRQWLGEFPGGMMFFLGCHLVDIIYRIQGKPDEIIPLSMSTGIDGVTAKDYGMAVFKYRNGISFAKTCASEHGGFIRRQIVVCGSKGTVEIKPTETFNEEEKIFTDSIMYCSDGRGEIKHRSEPVGRYSLMMQGFAAMVRGEKENPYSYEYESELYEILMKACGK